MPLATQQARSSFCVCFRVRVGYKYVVDQTNYMSVARRNAGCALRPAGVMALQQQRFFSGEVVDEAAVAKAAELKAIRNTERLAQERYKRDKTVTPWFARTVAPVAAQEAAPAGQVSQLAGVPNDIKRRKVTIYRPARAASSTGRFKTKAWKLNLTQSLAG